MVKETSTIHIHLFTSKSAINNNKTNGNEIAVKRIADVALPHVGHSAQEAREADGEHGVARIVRHTHAFDEHHLFGDMTR